MSFSHRRRQLRRKIYDDGDDLFDEVVDLNALPDILDPTPYKRMNKDTNIEKSWVHLGDSIYNISGLHKEMLPAGFYIAEVNGRTGFVDFKKKELHTDDLMIPDDPVYAEILKEVKTFFSSSGKFKEHGFVHSRGYMLHGPPGSGKTAIIQLLIKEYIKQGYLIIDGSEPEHLIPAVDTIRSIEKDRPLIVIFEDIDALFEYYGEEEFIQYLDGTNQTNHVLNIATTNYPEKLDKRITHRPRRFDRVVKIGMPSEAVRKQYFKEFHEISEDQLDKWVELTKGFSFSAMSDVVISVKCFDYMLEDAVEKLKDLLFKKKNSDNYDSEFTENGVGMGFN